jgi:hypothetical protein
MASIVGRNDGPGDADLGYLSKRMIADLPLD